MPAEDTLQEQELQPVEIEVPAAHRPPKNHSPGDPHKDLFTAFVYEYMRDVSTRSQERLRALGFRPCTAEPAPPPIVDPVGVHDGDSLIYDHCILDLWSLLAGARPRIDPDRESIYRWADRFNEWIDQCSARGVRIQLRFFY